SRLFRGSFAALRINCCRFHDAAAEERHLFELPEDVPGRLETLPVLRFRRGARKTGIAIAPIHAAKDARVGNAKGLTAGATRRARRARTSVAAAARRSSSATATTTAGIATCSRSTSTASTRGAWTTTTAAS